jgi:hypothetical protein
LENNFNPLRKAKIMLNNREFKIEKAAESCSKILPETDSKVEELVRVLLQQAKAMELIGQRVRVQFNAKLHEVRGNLAIVCKGDELLTVPIAAISKSYPSVSLNEK